MTVATTGGGSVITGMEDVRASDLRIPRIKIVHKEGVFLDPLTNTTFPAMNAIILGVVKQRTMWDREVKEGDSPLCKSTDHDTGYPSVNDDLPGRLRFPWAKQSAFSLETAERDEQGRPILPCNKCAFNKWVRDGSKNTPPPCSEVYVMPIMYSLPEDPEVVSTAMLSVQKTGIKPLTNYMSWFIQRKKPMFTRWTNIKLSLQVNGSVDYSVPIFTGGENTDLAFAADYASTYSSIREFLRRPPRSGDEEEGDDDFVVSDNSNTPAPSSAAAAPAPAAAPAAAEPAPAAAPVAPAPETPAAAPAAAPAPAPTPEPTPAPVAATEDDDDLPF